MGPISKSWSPDLTQPPALLYPLLLPVVLLMLLFAVLTKLNVDSLLDDAYMFNRHAENLITHGVLAWHPGGDPTYGLTAAIYAGVVAIFRLSTENIPLAIAAASVSSGILFVVALFGLLMPRLEAPTPWLRTLGLITAALVFFGGVDRIAHHFTTGMDTMWDLAWLTTWLTFALHVSSHPSTPKALF